MPFLTTIRARLATLGAVSLLAVAAACTENIEAGAGCPVLCPIENETVRDTVIEAVSLDTTVAGFPFPGEGFHLLVAMRPGADSIDVRSVIRFDSLPARFFPAGAADSADIGRVDSAFLRLQLDTAGLELAGPVTLEAYDVDTADAVDTTAAALSALFRPGRRIGAIRIVPDSLAGDTLRLPLSDAVVAAKAAGKQRLRVGLRLTGASAGRIRIYSSAAGTSSAGPRLSFDPGPDTTYTPLVLDPRSATPTGNAEVALGLRDFSFAALGTAPVNPSELRVGGVPGKRTLIRFSIPARLTDSTTIVRAMLRLVQIPDAGAERADSVILVPDVLVASDAVTDVRRIIALSSAGGQVSLDSVRIAPTDSGARELSLINLVRAWRTLPVGTQRGVVLRSTFEGVQATELRFYSAEAPAGMRPRLQISYVPRSNFGLP